MSKKENDSFSLKVFLWSIFGPLALLMIWVSYREGELLRNLHLAIVGLVLIGLALFIFFWVAFWLGKDNRKIPPHIRHKFRKK